MRIPRWLVCKFPFVGLASSIAAAMLIIVMAPAYAEVFSSFGVEPQVLGRFFIRFHLVFLFFPVLVFCIWKYWPYQGFRSLAAELFGVIGSIILLCLFMWAMSLNVRLTLLA